MMRQELNKHFDYRFEIISCGCAREYIRLGAQLGRRDRRAGYKMIVSKFINFVKLTYRSEFFLF
jgi:hypothetical protein